MSKSVSEAAARTADNVAFAILQVEVEALRTEVAALTESTQELVDAWKAANTVVKFVKLASTLLAAVGAVYLFFKHGFRAG